MVLSVPAGAWDVDWSTGFEQPTYAVGPLVPQDGWVLLSGASPNVQNVGPIHTGAQAVTQAVGASMAGKNLTGLNPGGFVYDSGWAKFWMYDPGDPGVQTDGRVGIQSSVGGSSVSTMFTAGVQTSRSPDYWVFQWSWSPVLGNGAAPSGTGYTFTAGPWATRVWNAWSYVILTWQFTYNVWNDPSSGGSGLVEWRINRPLVLGPNLTLNFDSTSGRWANSYDVAGVVLGSPYACDTPSSFDDYEFHSPLPEPSSLLALGAGLMGLAGLAIRRRR